MYVVSIEYTTHTCVGKLVVRGIRISSNAAYKQGTQYSYIHHFEQLKLKVFQLTPRFGLHHCHRSCIVKRELPRSNHTNIQKNKYILYTHRLHTRVNFLRLIFLFCSLHTTWFILKFVIQMCHFFNASSIQSVKVKSTKQ